MQIYYDYLIEFVLRHMDEIQKAIWEKRNDTTRMGHTGGSGTNHSWVSDPTALQAIRNVDDLDYVYVPFGVEIAGKKDERKIRSPERWLKVGHATQHRYTEETKDNRIREIYRRRYLIGGDDGESWRKTCADLSITQGFYYAVYHDIVRFAGMYAVGMGLIPPYGRFF